MPLADFIPLFGGVLDSAVGLSQQQSQNKFNLDMWNRQNVYNDPKNQMARLKSAGLNPNLVYGSGGVSGNTTSNAPQQEQVKTNFREAGMQTLQAQLMRQQAAVMQQDIKKSEAQEALYLASIPKVNSEVAKNQAQTSATIANEVYTKLMADTKRIEQKFTDVQQQNKVEEQQLNNAMKRIDLANLDKKYKTFFENLLAQTQNIRSNTAKTDVDAILSRLHVRMRELGIEPTDELLQRVGAQILSQGEKAPVVQKAKTIFKEITKMSSEQKKGAQNLLNNPLLYPVKP